MSENILVEDAEVISLITNFGTFGTEDGDSDVTDIRTIIGPTGEKEFQVTYGRRERRQAYFVPYHAVKGYLMAESLPDEEP